MEHRKNLRYHVQFRSSFSSTGMVGGEGTLMDLSVRGCRIDSLTNVQPGASLRVGISAIEHGPPIQIQHGVVRWSRVGQFGVEFVTMAPEEWARLQQIVKQIEMEPYERDRHAAERDESS